MVDAPWEKTCGPANPGLEFRNAETGREPPLVGAAPLPKFRLPPSGTLFRDVPPKPPT
jgi:hypothetical protein